MTSTTSSVYLCGLVNEKFVYYTRPIWDVPTENKKEPSCSLEKNLILLLCRKQNVKRKRHMFSPQNYFQRAFYCSIIQVVLITYKSCVMQRI